MEKERYALANDHRTYLVDMRERQLEGKLILEVPAQVNPIPQSVLRAAQEENVIIRDTTGRIYK